MSLSDVKDLAQGDVVLIRFPFTDIAGSKVRPAVLVSDTRVVSGKDGHFVFCGTNEPPPDSGFVVVDSDDARAMGLQRARSYVLPRKITTLEVSLARRRLGRTPPQVLTEILRRLGAALGIA